MEGSGDMDIASLFLLIRTKEMLPEITRMNAQQQLPGQAE